jgi:hypothetical protein
MSAVDWVDEMAASMGETMAVMSAVDWVETKAALTVSC